MSIVVPSDAPGELWRRSQGQRATQQGWKVDVVQTKDVPLIARCDDPKQER